MFLDSRVDPDSDFLVRTRKNDCATLSPDEENNIPTYNKTSSCFKVVLESSSLCFLHSELLLACEYLKAYFESHPAYVNDLEVKGLFSAY